MTEIKTTAEAVEAAVMQRCHAVIAVDAAPTVEQKPLPEGVISDEDAQKSQAEWAYERLILYIQNFEEQLDSAHEIAMGVAGADVGVIHIEGMGFYAPDLVTFYGTDPAGSRMQLVQHVSQLNVMLMASPKRTKEPHRIGFHLVEQLGKKSSAGETVKK
ncbi:MAG: DUF6173 family protein [Paracoccaceae bacterium]